MVHAGTHRIDSSEREPKISSNSQIKNHWSQSIKASNSHFWTKVRKKRNWDQREESSNSSLEKKVEQKDYESN